MTHARRRDGNQSEIVETLRKLGWYVIDLAGVAELVHCVPGAGPGGLPDLLISKDDRIVFVEVKRPGEKRSLLQGRFADLWPGDVVVVRSVEDCLALGESRYIIGIIASWPGWPE